MHDPAAMQTLIAGVAAEVQAAEDALLRILIHLSAAREISVLSSSAVTEPTVLLPEASYARMQEIVREETPDAQ